MTLPGDGDNPIRDIVYRILDEISEKSIQEGFLRGDGPQVIDCIVGRCRDDVMAVQGCGDGDEKACTMATVLLHYLLSVLLVPSQRKIQLDGVPVDVVIPDARAMRTDWNSCIVLCVLASVRPEYVEARISEAKAVQPNEENVWIVSPRPIACGFKTFVVGRMDPGGVHGTGDCKPFAQIINHINRFLDKTGSAKLRMFRAV